ncbi:expressed unknown protein [Seminavis robusta]|uniref:Uncharacterized protein n=1 Tax=Seminavis robusta TaxID=568900 RepID=A0A9N8HLB6_9STRA|nr:expressed unknown protein [Seminavis robusta]|eukprot:Sro1017_g231760.1 n/a (227) ;mRNA; f:20918-21598
MRALACWLCFLVAFRVRPAEGSCTTKKYCEQIAFVQECKEAYSCSYNVRNGQLTSCKNGGDCRKLGKDKCQEYVNCQWKDDEPVVHDGFCSTQKYCDEIGVIQGCKEAYSCSYNVRNGQLTSCKNGGDCRKLGKDKCQEYVNCRWNEATGPSETEEGGGDGNDGGINVDAAANAEDPDGGTLGLSPEMVIVIVVGAVAAIILVAFVYVHRHRFSGAMQSFSNLTKK